MAALSSINIDINTYFDKIFYINLSKDVARNEAIVKQLHANGITNFERFEAIKLPEIPELCKYRNFNKTDLKYIIGQVSCRASHVECIRIAKERGYKKVLILEDDIVMLINPQQLINANTNILNDWDMLYFGGLIEPYFRNQIVCAHAYAVRDTLFDNILYMAEDSGMEIDNFYAKVLQHMSYNGNVSGKYNIRIIRPFNQIVQNTAFASNIQGG